MTGQVDAVGYPAVTVVVTSCRRFDLLEKTLKSFVEYNDYPVAEIIVIEDSDDGRVHDVCASIVGVPCRVILNGQNIGQIRSIDKAYSEVNSRYIFHMEDDWVFSRTGVIASLVRIMEHETNALLALARCADDMPRYVRSLRNRSFDGVDYKIVFPELHHLWHTFTFNPGLKRLSDYKLLSGGYQAIGDEAAISRHYKALKRDMLWLADGGIRHIGVEGRSNYGHGVGFGRSRASIGSRLWRSGNLEKWRRSLARWFWHLLRLAGVDTETLQRRGSRRGINA